MLASVSQTTVLSISHKHSTQLIITIQFSISSVHLSSVLRIALYEFCSRSFPRAQLTPPRHTRSLPRVPQLTPPRARLVPYEWHHAVFVWMQLKLLHAMTQRIPSYSRRHCQTDFAEVVMCNDKENMHLHALSDIDNILQWAAFIYSKSYYSRLALTSVCQWWWW